MTRLPYLLPADLDGDARAVYDSIAGGARAKSRAFPLTTDEGGLLGPFNAMLYSPEVGDALQRLGAAIRFESSLPDHLRELAILLVAHHWTSDFEWWAHERVGRAAGLAEDVLEAVRTGGEPTLADDEAAVRDLCLEVLVSREATDPTFERVRSVLGEQGTVELLTLIGYYTTLAMILNVFEVGVPEGEESPFG